MDPKTFPTDTDEALAARAQQGDRDAVSALLVRRAGMVAAIAAGFAGGKTELEDLIQEGMLALLSSAYSFSPEKGALFRTYASVCVTNRLRSVVKQANAQKNLPLKDYVPLDSPDALQIADPADPESTVISEESAADLFRSIRALLSALELRVLKCFLKGYSYRETAAMLGMTEKAVSNAMQRARAKLKKLGDATGS